MKIVIFILGCILLINSISCFSQLDEKCKKELKSKTKYVCGYSNEFTETLSMGITFGKGFSSIDTTYFIKFDLYSPKTNYRADICLDKTGVISFLAKSGNLIELKLKNARSSINSDEPINNLRSTFMVYNNSTTLIIEVTKEELIKIGSEPFYKT